MVASYVRLYFNSSRSEQKYLYILLTNGGLDVILGIFRQIINACLPNCTNCVDYRFIYDLPMPMASPSSIAAMGISVFATTPRPNALFRYTNIFKFRVSFRIGLGLLS